MTREIVLDTETTGFDPARGDRMVEVACLELVNRLPTGAYFHRYIDPERSVPAEAAAVHGLTDEKLRGQPKFREIAQDFLDFIGEAPLVIHNAAFDMKFLSHELALANKPTLPYARAVDTLAMARTRFPGAPATLDALCRRFGVDNSGRQLHGALIDCELLAGVYLELTGGRQIGFGLDAGPKGRRASVSPASEGLAAGGAAAKGEAPAARRPSARPALLTSEEAAAHEAFVRGLGEAARWRRPS
ncbi:DNA polymerase III subunit epsilon [Neomegalonema perideroedes]|uniref:DNA polymerase III subunit epsilon n=1 Tax=Neomegalonema perideroedes TaxID=217219 RepID=UPI00035DD7A9|nr:DNA polymerase III subunit epsilon [Neomegalonema perideroedes]